MVYNGVSAATLRLSEQRLHLLFSKDLVESNSQVEGTSPTGKALQVLAKRGETPA